MKEKTTLVAFYGRKSGLLDQVLANIQGLIGDFPSGTEFRPYPRPQVHATIIGVETETFEDQAYSINYLEKYGIRKPVNLKAIEPILNEFLPMHVRIGGFSPGFDQISSRGQSLYDRSCFLDPQSGQVVLCGWPHTGEDFSGCQLMELRNKIEEQCFLSHKYAGDNDLYMVVGTFETRGLNSRGQKTDLLFSQIRNSLARTPVEISLTRDSVQAVRYTDPGLPENSSGIIPLSQLNELGI